jgi:predicted O-methyltransferase YrrM
MIDELKEIAIRDHVPILSDDGLDLVATLIKAYGVQTVLEIGTAIGYSAISMASLGVSVDTIERADEMISEAEKHVRIYDTNRMVRLIYADALTYEGLNGSYDMIFIDAAKAQYRRLFEKYEKHLNPQGIIVCDNMRFHDLKPENVSRHTRQLLKKIAMFKTFLQGHDGFETTFFDHVGDGMSVSRRRLP